MYPSLAPLILLVLLCLPATRAGAAKNIDSSLFNPDVDLFFERITLDDGLPENSVRASIQDRTGFVWLGTQNGLVRYDGNSMTIFSPDPDDPASLGGRTIDSLFEDRGGDIWVGSYMAGLWRYDGTHGGFHRIDLHCGRENDLLHIFHISDDKDGTIWVASDCGLASVDPVTEAAEWHPAVTALDTNGVPVAISVVLVEDTGRIWCGTESAGLAHYDPSSGEVEWFRHDPQDDTTVSQDEIFDIYQDPGGRIWVATAGGISLWEESRSRFWNFVPEPGSTTIRFNVMVCLAMDESGILWAGSAAGLYAFDPVLRQFRLFIHDSNRPSSPVNGPVLSLLIDRSGVIWAGSWHTGLSKTDPSAGRFRLTEFSLPDKMEATGTVQSIMEDPDGNIWVGVAERPQGVGDGAVYVKSGPEKDWRLVPTRSVTGHPLYSVIDVHRTGDGTVFAATYRGLWQVVNGVLVPVSELVPAFPLEFDRSIKSLVSDSKGILWVGTWSGLVRWDRNSNEFQFYRNNPDDRNSLGSNNIFTLHLDQSDRLWVAFDTQGLDLYQTASNDFRHYFSREKGLETVGDFHEYGDGNLWLASYAGLVKFDPESGETEIFGRKHGLPTDRVSSIAEDESGVFWLSTGFGIARFNPATREVRRYDTRDGLPDNQVKFTSILGSDGRVYLGGEVGLVDFNPKGFTKSNYQPTVVVTDVKVSGESINIGPGNDLGLLPHLASKLELPHDRNDLSFEFASLDFSRPSQNVYAYKMDGLDDDWIDPGKARNVVYNNLPPGKYTFRVRGSNRDGHWSDSQATLEVIIHPPWHETNWAYAAYLLLFVVFILALGRQLTHRERMRSRLTKQRIEAEKLQELDDLKTRFLTNITHEFRTPLTLIKVPLMGLKTELKGVADEKFDTMIRNANRLEELINQLLDLSRLEAGKLPVQWKNGDSIAFLGLFVSAFESLAEQRGISLEIKVPQESFNAWYDEDLVEKLVGNLISNAINHTPGKGQVMVSVSAGPEEIIQPSRLRIREFKSPVPAREVIITVTNSGSYIPPEDIERVFDRFYQATTARGSGVGLSLVKELAGWMGGRVEASSDPEIGTSFTVVVPVFLEHPGGEMAADILVPDQESTEPDDRDPDPLDLDEEEDGDGNPRILIVEDNQDLRSYMASDLASEYVILEAVDGTSGLETAIAEIPDLVLSDVMMPGMDGFELCRRLKEDERTCHIPVILLTARAEPESRREGLRQGADDYLAKPFDAEELRLRIRNQIDHRRKLAEDFERRLAALTPDTIPVTSADDKFLTQMREVVDANLEDADLSGELICREVAMSRSQLHRKLKALTGRSVSDFVRTRRLQRAVQLMDGGYGNVTDITFAVGFRHLSYFSKSFRALYGMQPSEYLKSVAEKKDKGN